MNIIKRVFSVALAMVIIAAGALCTASGDGLHAQAASYIDNSSLLPAYVPDSKVELDSNGTPKWVEQAIFACVNLNTATPEGTLEASVKVLDHYAEMGVNCLWLLPVYDPGTADYPNGYENMGPASINPKLTGTTDYEAGWKKMAWFVEEAHKRNIRILLDIISWGIRGESPLVTEHPEFISDCNGAGSYYFNWNNDDWVEYWISNAVNIVKVTNCDGLRYDTEPSYAGYEVCGEIRERLWAMGRKPLMMSERENERGHAFDIGQAGMTEGVSHETYKSVEPVYFWLDKYNIVDSIKEGVHYGTQESQDLGFGGTYHYYTYSITNHDNKYPVVLGNRAAIGYQAMFTPFLPLMLLGEEFNNPNHHNNPNDGAMYFNSVDWSLLDQAENRALYEDIKAMIRVRRSYPELFCYYPDEFVESNICKVNVTNCEVAQPYARYADGEAMLVIPNNNLHEKDAKMTVYMPFSAAGLDYYKNYVVTDVMTGEVIAQGSASKVASFTVTVPYENQRLFLVKATGKIVPSEVDPDASSENNGNEDPESDVNNNTDISDIEDPGADVSETPDDSEPENVDSEPDDPTSEPENVDSEPGDPTSELSSDNEQPADTKPAVLVWPFVVGGVAVVGVVVAVVLVVAKKRRRQG